MTLTAIRKFRPAGSAFQSDRFTETQYGLSLAASDSGTVPMLGMKNIVNGKIDTKNANLVSVSSNELSDYQLMPGDLLFNRTNSFDLVGKTALFDLNSEQPFVFASYLIRLAVDKECADPAYVCHFLNAETSQKRLKDMATPGVSQFNINPSTLRNHFFITLPPLSEQTGDCGRVVGVGSGDFADRRTDRRERTPQTGLDATTSVRPAAVSGVFDVRNYVPARLSRAHESRREPLLSTVEVPIAKSAFASHGERHFLNDPVEGRRLETTCESTKLCRDAFALNIVFAWERASAVTR